MVKKIETKTNIPKFKSNQELKDKIKEKLEENKKKELKRGRAAW